MCKALASWHTSTNYHSSSLLNSSSTSPIANSPCYTAHRIVLSLSLYGSAMMVQLPQRHPLCVGQWSQLDQKA